MEIKRGQRKQLILPLLEMHAIDGRLESDGPIAGQMNRNIPVVEKITLTLSVLLIYRIKLKNIDTDLKTDIDPSLIGSYELWQFTYFSQSLDIHDEHCYTIYHFLIKIYAHK